MTHLSRHLIKNLPNNAVSLAFIVSCWSSLAHAAPFIEVTPNSKDDKAALERMSEEAARVNLTPKNNGRWTLVTPDSGKATITIPDSTKQPPIGEDLPSAAFASFVPVVEGKKILLQPKLSHDWGRFSLKLNDDKSKEIEKLVTEYSKSLKDMIEAGDPQFYQPTTPEQNSEFERLTEILRRTLLDEAGGGEIPALAIAAARTFVCSFDQLQADEQGLARGMTRVSSRASEHLQSAAYGVAEVIAGEATVGVCTRTSKSACVTAAHVVKNYVNSPAALKVRFHVKGDQGNLVSVTVPVNKVAIREDWSPLALHDGAKGAVAPVFDAAFLELKIEELQKTGQEKHLANFNRATICTLATSPLTANSILSQRQFFHISYDPRQPKNNGPQTQYRCILFCPAMTQSSEDYNQVFYNLFERCLISNAKRILSDKPDITALCNRPLKEKYLPSNYFQDSSNSAIKYFTPMISGTRRVAISYEATTFPGDSGAPVFWYDESQDLIEIVAIHMAGDNLEFATPFSAERCAYATPVYLIHPEDLKNYCAN